jgi:hypothetical protein
MTDRVVEQLLGVAGIVIAFLASWLFYYLGETKNERRERERQKWESEFPATVTKYSWEDFVEGAKKVGKFIINEYKPDAIIIFSGSSSVFSSLMLELSLDRQSLLTTRLFTARFIGKEGPADPALLRGHEVLENSLARFNILIPESLRLDADRRWRIAIIDDTTTTGMSMNMVRDHLRSLGFNNVKTACFTCITRKKISMSKTLSTLHINTQQAMTTSFHGARNLFDQASVRLCRS